MRLLEHRAVDRGDVRAPVDVAEEQAVAACAGDLVDAAQDLGVERVADVPDDHAEQRAPAAAQRPGEEVGLVAEVRRRGEDPLAGRLADGHAGLAAVEDPRDRRDRDAGPLRDVAERDRPATAFATSCPPALLTPRTIVPVRRKRQGLSLTSAESPDRRPACAEVRRSRGATSRATIRSSRAVRACPRGEPDERRRDRRRRRPTRGFRTVFGRELVAELPNFVHRPYLVVTMADLWPWLEHHFDRHLAAVHEVTTHRAVATLDAQVDGLPEFGGGRRARRRPGARRREVLRLAPRPAPLPGPDGDDHERRVQPPLRAASRGPRGRDRLGRAGGGLRRRRPDPERPAPAQPERRRRRPLPPHRPLSTGSSRTTRVGRIADGRMTSVSSPRRASSSRPSSAASTRSTTSATPGSGCSIAAHRWAGASFHEAGWNACHLDGVDHAFLDCLEYQTGRHFIHGQAIGLGTYLGAVLQENEPERRPRLAPSRRGRHPARGDGDRLGGRRDGDAAARLVRPPRGPAVHDRRRPARDRRRSSTASATGSPPRSARGPRRGRPR